MHLIFKFIQSVWNFNSAFFIHSFPSYFINSYFGLPWKRNFLHIFLLLHIFSIAFLGFLWNFPMQWILKFTVWLLWKLDQIQVVSGRFHGKSILIYQINKVIINPLPLTATQNMYPFHYLSFVGRPKNWTKLNFFRRTSATLVGLAARKVSKGETVLGEYWEEWYLQWNTPQRIVAINETDALYRCRFHEKTVSF